MASNLVLSLRTSWRPFCRSLPVCSVCRYPFQYSSSSTSSTTTSSTTSSSSSNNDSSEQETFEGPIPREKLTITFSRSSGPGGQNVNKLNTKAEVRFHVDSADWLPQRVRDRLLTMFRSKVTKEGEIIVTSQEHRTQLRNVESAVARLEKMVEEASEVPRGPSELTMARIKLLKKKAQQRKRVEKKYHSFKKQDRKRTDFD